MNLPTVREATAEDMPRIRKLHQQIEEKMGEKMDLPEISIERDGEPIPNPAILGYWVVELDGEVIEFFYVEKCAEICFGGSDPRATAVVAKFQQDVLERMAMSGIRMLHCHVPPAFHQVGKHLCDSDFIQTGYLHYHLGLLTTMETLTGHKP